METETEKRDGKLDDHQTWKSPTTKLTSVNIDARLWEIAKNNNIGLKDAMEFGIKFLYSDKNEADWPEDTNLWEKFQKVIKHRNALLTENMGLREQVPEIVEDQENVKKDLDNVFGGVKKNE